MENNIFKTALVLEGGGMRECFSSGVLNVLLDHELYFDYVSGISAGACNALSYLSRDQKRIKECFVDFSNDPQFGSIRTFIKGKGLFNAQYIYQEASRPGGSFPFDFESYIQNPGRLDIGAYNVTKDTMEYWDRSQLSTMKDTALRAQASSTLPIVMPPVVIDGQMYVDGGVGDGGIALDIAKKRGFDHFLIILTQEKGYRAPENRRMKFIERKFKEYPQLIEAIRQCNHKYNETLDEIARLEEEGRAYAIYPERMTATNHTRKVEILQEMYDQGKRQADRDLNAIKYFIRSYE